MRRFNSLFTTLPFIATLLLGACASVDIDDYRDQKPPLDIREYFSGNLDAWGVVKDRSGRVTRHFNATLVGQWNGDNGTLDEKFIWSDGERQSRIWSLSMRDAGSFVGSAHDVVGDAIGRQRGNAIQMQYVLRVPRGDGSIDIAMDDWMYRTTENCLLNETTMRKFGIRVGSILIGFCKR
jgi:uncharacterized protein DUF3833